MNRYTSAGKEVLRDGSHFADACSPDDAATIATAMNAGLADVSIELRECPTCKRLGAHEAECVERSHIHDYRERLQVNYGLDKAK